MNYHSESPPVAMATIAAPGYRARPPLPSPAARCSEEKTGVTQLFVRPGAAGASFAEVFVFVFVFFFVISKHSGN